MPKAVVTGIIVAGGVVLVVLGVRAWRKGQVDASPAASTPRLGTRVRQASGTLLAFARDQSNLAAAEVAGASGRYPT